MKLADWIRSQGMTRIAFARQIGVAPSRITDLCEYGGWPSRATAQKIYHATGGVVTPTEWLEAKVRARSAA